MKKYINFTNGFIAALLLILTISCASLVSKNQGVFGKASQKQADQKARVENIEKSIGKNDQEKLTGIGAWAEGTDYALKKVPDPSKEVEVAKTVNDRVKALANKPNFDEVKEVQAIIDQLLSDFKAEQDKGKKALANKDDQIYSLNLQMRVLQEEKDGEITKYMRIAEANALKTDQYKATLNEMDSFFGFGAIWYGLKKLIVRGAWILGIGSVLYLILRALSVTNPAVRAVFGIFEQIFAGVIKVIQGIAPRAVQFAGHVSAKLFEGYKGTLTKLVDAIELVKERENATGGAKKYTIDELLVEVSKSMDQEDKDRIAIAKKELKW